MSEHTRDIVYCSRTMSMLLLATKHVVCWVWHWETAVRLRDNQLSDSPSEPEPSCVVKTRCDNNHPVTCVIFLSLSFTLCHVLSHGVKVQLVGRQPCVVGWGTELLRQKPNAMLSHSVKSFDWCSPNLSYWSHCCVKVHLMTVEGRRSDVAVTMWHNATVTMTLCYCYSDMKQSDKVKMWSSVTRNFLKRLLFFGPNHLKLCLNPGVMQVWQMWLSVDEVLKYRISGHPWYRSLPRRHKTHKCCKSRMTHFSRDVKRRFRRWKDNDKIFYKSGHGMTHGLGSWFWLVHINCWCYYDVGKWLVRYLVVFFNYRMRKKQNLLLWRTLDNTQVEVGVSF